jgi:hypothetical protein
MATKRRGRTMEEKFSTVMQAGVMEIQREIIDDFDANEVFGINGDEDDDEDEEAGGSDIEEIDDDDLDEDDSDDDDLDEDDDEDD